jgi:hypothetical protein
MASAAYQLQGGPTNMRRYSNPSIRASGPSHKDAAAANDLKAWQRALKPKKA